MSDIETKSTKRKVLFNAFGAISATFLFGGHLVLARWKASHYLIFAVAWGLMAIVWSFKAYREIQRL